MIAFVVLLCSFVIAIIGYVHSHRTTPDKAVRWGLSGIGLTLITVASMGFVAGLAKVVVDANAAAEAARREAERTQLLKQIHAKIMGVQSAVDDNTLASELGGIADQISGVASMARESDFRLSDFSRSNFSVALFRDANFDKASFENASLRDATFEDAHFNGSDFDSAHFEGVDLRGIIIDDQTKLPTR